MRRSHLAIIHSILITTVLIGTVAGTGDPLRTSAGTSLASRYATAANHQPSPVVDVTVGHCRRHRF